MKLATSPLRRGVLGVLLAGLCTAVQAGTPLGFSEYLTAVEQHNLDYAAQKENVVAARAGIDLAGVRPDPQFSLGTTRELARESKPTATRPNTIGLSQTFETAGKRARRIDAAQADLRLAESGVGAYFFALSSDAVDAFIALIHAREVLKRRETSYKALQEVVSANELRLKAGAIGRLELSQSILEAQRYGKDVEAARADLRAAEAQLSVPLGQPFTERFAGREPDAALNELTALPTLDALLDKARERRADVVTARTAVDAARARYELAQANRWVDVNVGASLTNTAPVENVSERSRALGLSVAVPIPLSRLQQGELIQARAAQTQAELGLQSSLVRVRSEVETAVARYQSALSVVREYRNRTLEENRRVLEGFRLSYQKGAASLLELLNAQRTADDTYLDYLDALASYAKAKTVIQTSIGERPDLDGGF